MRRQLHIPSRPEQKQSGLVAGEEDSSGTFKEEANLSNQTQNDYYESVAHQNEDHHAPSKPIKERSVKVVASNIETQNSEVNEKFKELVVKDNGLWRCTVCDKTMKSGRDMKRHLETHLEGLSYDCQYCGKTFRSVNALRQHKCRESKY